MAAAHFSFALAANEIGGDQAPANYFMRIAAPGYVTRMIQLGLRPTQAGLFALTMHALDSQPAGGGAAFDLVRDDVRIEDLAALP